MERPHAPPADTAPGPALGAIDVSHPAKTPADAIRRYAKLVRALPPRARAVWTQASKELDIGVQAGFEHRSAEWVLDPSVVEAIAAMGARVRFTVYSPLLIIDEEARSRRRARAKRDRR